MGTIFYLVRISVISGLIAMKLTQLLNSLESIELAVDSLRSMCPCVFCVAGLS